jgi:hypothetical protein
MNAVRILFSMATLTVAPTSQAQTFLPIPFPTPQYELNGFAVTPPTGEHWFVKSGATRALVEFSRSTELGRNHTVLAWAESFELPSAEGTVDDIVRQITAPISQAFKEDSRYTNIEVTTEKTSISMLSCSKFSFSVQDRGVPYAPGKIFTMQGWEVYCLHPRSPRPLVLKLAHSQRYLHEGKLLPLETELKIFREGVQVRPVSATGETENTSSSARRLYDACIPIETKDGLTGSGSRAPMNSQDASRYAHLLCSVIADNCAKEPQSERCKKSLRDYGLRD